MKILKPGKVEQWKFVCKRCGCEFAANTTEVSYSLGYYIPCPCCKNKLWESCGEPYEEPTPTQTDRERLTELICDLLNRETISRECIVEYLIAHGVTFREV